MNPQSLFRKFKEENIGQSTFLARIGRFAKKILHCIARQGRSHVPSNVLMSMKGLLTAWTSALRKSSLQ